MTTPIDFLFLSDSPIFGGHEQVCLDLITALPTDATIAVAAPSTNSPLFSQTRKCRPLTHIHLKHSYRRGGVYFGRFNLPARLELRDILARHHFSHIVLMQGRIEAAIPYMLELRRLSLPFTSIIPFAHSIGEIKGQTPFRQIEDHARRSLYQLPAQYIVPSASAALQLRARKAHQPIFILPNLVSIPKKTTHTGSPRKLARCIGRIEFKQKQQDLLVRLIASAPSLFDDFVFEFVGSGPDAQRLQQLIDRCNIGDRVRITNHIDRAHLFENTSVTLLPSRFEGLPLIMLEALSIGIPFVGSNIDVLREYLPAFAINEFHDPIAFRECLDRSISPEARHCWNHLSERVAELHGEAAYRRHVDELLKVWPPRLPS